MRLSEYIYDIKGILLTCFAGGLFFTFVLAAFGIGTAQLALLWVCFCLFLFTTLFCCWRKKSSRLSYLSDTFDALEPKYLLAEIADAPDSAMEGLYFRLLRTALKSMTDEVAASRRQTREYQEFLEQWVHEIKLPVTGIELLCENNKTDVTRKILAQTQRIGQDVEKVLFCARLGAAEKDCLIREVSLRECVMDVLARNQQLLIESGVSVHTECLSHTVCTDPRWLSFLLTQLISNSLKYRSGRPPVLDISSRERDGHIELTVTDNGVGIRPSELPRIFDKGFVGSNGRSVGAAAGSSGAAAGSLGAAAGSLGAAAGSSGAAAGSSGAAAGSLGAATGMGLYLCAQLCERLGIEIRAESEWNLSTSVCLCFPRS